MSVSLRIFDYFVIAVGVVLASVVGFSFRTSPIAALCLAVLVLIATWLSVIDFREHRLPNRIVGPLAAVATILLLIAGVVTNDLQRGFTAVAAGVASTLVLLVMSVVGGLGMGDVKFAYPLGAVLGWFGWSPILVAVIVMTVGGAIAGLVVLASGKGSDHRICYGPYMALGLVAGLLYSTSTI